MSVTYWMNEGIGVRCSHVEPHLDGHKCYLEICKLLPDEHIEEDGFDLDDFLYGNPFENLGDFLSSLDETDVTTYGDDGDSQYYFLYSPKFPWHMKKNEPNCVEEVHRRIVDVLMKVTNLSRVDADKLIDDYIYDVGIG